MDRLQRFLVLLVKISFFSQVGAETFTVKIHTENHVNQVDSKFISFTVDPRHLFSSNDKYKGKDSTCMAASLAPAYIRIAGPSTSHITFHNTSMSIDDLPELPEPSKHKRYTQRQLLDSEEKDEILSKLKSIKDGARRPKRALTSQETEKSDSHESYEALPLADDVLSAFKKSRVARKQKKPLLTKETENHQKDSHEDKQSNDDIISKLKNSSQDRLTKKQKKPLPNSQETESIKEDNHASESSNDDILSNLKKSTQDRLAKKLKKPLRESHEAENDKDDDHESILSNEDIISKLKKSSQDTLARITRKQKKPQDTQEDQNEDSQESILSKLKKSKRQGGLLKLKQTKDIEEVSNRNRLRRSRHGQHLEVHHRQWQRFIRWAKNTGFDLVFAVNNGEKTETGMWDPNPAMNMLTIADQDNVTDIFWQLGYECSNQTIEDYLNDLETLRVMVDTFGRNWKVVGGDITNCLQEGSKSDFKDYVMLSTDSMDAVLLNGNSSSRELERMSPSSRLALLRSLSSSATPLWLTELPQRMSETARAADWLTSLGYSARNGFDVHFRELVENELYEPTLSFYMALLFKNLVGERVLDVTMDPSEGNAAVFAHCTSLRHKAVPGAVTIFGVNMDEEAARFAVKLSRREEGGDIMQFILGHDSNGNIVVNGRAMYYEGDIRPVVKRVRPYKTLLLNLPPKTFGFWVLANTKVDACYDYEEKSKVTLVEAKPVKTSEEKNNATEEEEDDDKKQIDEKKHRVRRSLNADDFSIDLNGIDNEEAVKNRIDSINRGLDELRGTFSNDVKFRAKRQLDDDEFDNRKKRRHGLKKYKHEHKLIGSGIFEKIMSNINLPKLNLANNLKELKLKSRINKNKQSKRHSRNYRNKEDLHDDDEEYLSRRKRSLFSKHDKNDSEDRTIENEVDYDEKPVKYGKILHREVKKIMEDNDTENKSHEGDADEIEINTKLTNDDAVFKITENADHGLLKYTFENVLSVLEELNHNLNKIWTALSILG